MTQERAPQGSHGVPTTPTQAAPPRPTFITFDPTDQSPQVVLDWLSAQGVIRVGWLVYAAGDEDRMAERWIEPQQFEYKVHPDTHERLFAWLWTKSNTLEPYDQEGEFVLTVATGELRRLGGVYEVTYLEKLPDAPEAQVVVFLRQPTEAAAD